MTIPLYIILHTRIWPDHIDAADGEMLIPLITNYTGNRGHADLHTFLALRIADRQSIEYNYILYIEREHISEGTPPMTHRHSTLILQVCVWGGGGGVVLYTMTKYNMSNE